MSEHVVLVHGLFVRALVMARLAKRLRAAGFQTHLFNYKTRSQAMPVLARRLYEFIQSRRLESVNILAHSMGGLVTLEMLAQHSSLPPGRIVLIGSPVNGNKLAQRMAPGRAGRVFFGKSGPALAGGAKQAVRGHEIGVIAGSRPYGLGRLVSIFDEPNDGTVAVAETLLEGSSDFIELPVTHTGMLFSTAVAEQSICFFKSGAFQQKTDGA